MYKLFILRFYGASDDRVRAEVEIYERRGPYLNYFVNRRSYFTRMFKVNMRHVKLCYYCAKLNDVILLVC